MKCNGFKNWHLGKWTDEQFLAHVKDCPVCAKAEQKDNELLNMARSLKKEVDVPWLWPLIETAVKQETKPKKNRVLHVGWWTRPAFRMAAVLVLGIGLGLLLRSGILPSRSGILNDSALKRVENSEKAYESAIAELEKAAGAHLASMDMELTLLYRDRLETIDDQIETCKDELMRNPANTHVRHYLLAALRDKKETLTEIMDWHPTDPAGTA